LRRRFAEKVEATLCFDLFCGCGSYLQAIYLDRFERCVAVDKQRKSLQQLPDRDNLMIYQGDNAQLAPRLCRQYGFPDFVDLDAFGNPDAPLLAMLPWLHDKERFAVVATDGTMAARQSFGDPPHCWGYGAAKWSPASLALADYPTMIYRHLQDWTERVGYAVAEFEFHRKPSPWAVVYYGALIEKMRA